MEGRTQRERRGKAIPERERRRPFPDPCGKHCGERIQNIPPLGDKSPRIGDFQVGTVENIVENAQVKGAGHGLPGRPVLDKIEKHVQGYVSASS